MAVKDYYRVILNTLQGRTEDLRTLSPERRDWAGPGAVLHLYGETSGRDRTALIRAIGRVIEKHPASPAVIAQLINIASSLDLAQVEPQVRTLQEDPFAAQEPLKGAITNYLAFRRLNTSAEAAGHRAPTNRPKTRKIRSERPPHPEPASAGKAGKAGVSPFGRSGGSQRS